MAARDRMERSPEEIRREIERTRSHMDEAVEAIGDRLSPGKFVDELWLRAQQEGAAAVTSTLRDHPIPFALVGLGLGWLVMEQARGRPGHVGSGTYGRAEGRVGPYRGDAVNQDDPDWEYAGTGTKVKAKMADAAHAVTDKVSEKTHAVGEHVAGAAHAVGHAAHAAQEKVTHAAHAAQERVSSAAHTAGEHVAHAAHATQERVSQTAHRAMDGARRGAERTKDGFSTMLDRNPMALGAIAFSLGVASGASAPSTRWEDEKLGRFSGPLKDEAKQALQDTAQKVKGVARDAMDAAKTELEHQREQATDPLQQVVNQLKQSARETLRAAEHAARERATSEGLDPEGMKQMARRARDRARETAGS